MNINISKEHLASIILNSFNKALKEKTGLDNPLNSNFNIWEDKDLSQVNRFGYYGWVTHNEKYFGHSWDSIGTLNEKDRSEIIDYLRDSLNVEIRNTHYNPIGAVQECVCTKEQVLYKGCICGGV